MRAQLFVYDPDNPNRDAVLAYLCSSVEQRAAETGKPIHISVTDPKKSRIQEQKYHAMLTDIARDVRLTGRKGLDSEVWKRVCIEQFRHETKNDPDFRELWTSFGDLQNVLSIDGERAVSLGEQSRNFGVKLASAFIDWLYAFGTENNVTWKELEKHERGMK